jgi:alpha-galactosidase
MSVLQFEHLQITATFDNLATSPGGYILKGRNVALKLPFSAQAYYHHGWQSWSLAAWGNPATIPTPQPAILNPMQIDPLYAQHPTPNGSWLGAVELPGGGILLLGALNLDSHVQLREGILQGWYEDESLPPSTCEWFVIFGSEEKVFDTYAFLLGQRLGHGRVQTAYRVWCSWYSLYTAIDERSLQSIFDGLDDLPFDVLQVDDGWQIDIGDWQANSKFPSGMNALAEKIKTSGRKAGLWLAPLLVSASSSLCRDHREWLLHNERGKLVSAGFNWGEQLYALDTTHPLALEWLAALMKQVRAWGFEYIKLDFLYAGALPGKRHTPMPREAAYRRGLSVMRKELGQAYLLTCGAPILPSLGLCDAMRIGPDVSAQWESYRDAVLLYNPTTPGAKNAIRTTLNRLWLKPIVHTDPDVVFFRSSETGLSGLTPEQNVLLQDLAQICEFKATSDPAQWLTQTEKTDLRAFLTGQPKVKRSGRYAYMIDKRLVDFSPVISMPTPPMGINRLVANLTGWLGSLPIVLFFLDRLRRNALEKIKDQLR